MSQSYYSAAMILRQLLIDLGIGTVNGAWPVFIALAQAVPDNALIIYDTAGFKDGRLMQGDLVIHPGVQVRIRSKDYQPGAIKAKEISDRLATVSRAEVAMDSVKAYTVVNITQTGDIQPIGYVQEGDRTNHNFTVNVTTTIEEQEG